MDDTAPTGVRWWSVLVTRRLPLVPILVSYYHCVTSVVWPDDFLSADLGYVDDVRQRVPVLQQRRTDLYALRQCLKWVVCTAGTMFVGELLLFIIPLKNIGLFTVLQFRIYVAQGRAGVGCKISLWMHTCTCRQPIQNTCHVLTARC